MAETKRDDDENRNFFGKFKFQIDVINYYFDSRQALDLTSAIRLSRCWLLHRGTHEWELIGHGIRDVQQSRLCAVDSRPTGRPSFWREYGGWQNRQWCGGRISYRSPNQHQFSGRHRVRISHVAPSGAIKKHVIIDYRYRQINRRAARLKIQINSIYIALSFFLQTRPCSNAEVSKLFKIR